MDKDYQGLVDLTVREQIIVGCPKDLAVFLRERRPKSITELTKMADQYMLAHMPVYDQIRQNKRISGGSKSKTNDSNVAKQASQDKSIDSRFQEKPKCFNCGMRGHIAKYCRKPPRENSQQPSRNKIAGLEVVKEIKGERKEASPPESEPLGACLELKSPCTLLGQLGKPVKLACGHELPIVSAACTLRSGMPVVKGIVGSHVVEVLRDTGCSTTVIRKSLVPEDQMLGLQSRCVLLDGTVRSYPVARIEVDSPYFKGTIEALCMENPLYGLVLGNIPGVREPDNPDPLWKLPVMKDELAHQDAVEDTLGAVQTRSQKTKLEKPFSHLRVPTKENVASKYEFANEQKTDATLANVRNLAEKGSVRITGSANETRFVKDADLYFREFKSPKVERGRLFRQLVVPKIFRNQVLKLAHDSAMAGHLGVKKTCDRVLANFYWPRLQGDVRRYCASCDICQRTVSKGKVVKVPLDKMPLIDTPFRRVAVDIVGPIHPVTDQGNRYILTIVDYATRYPEAVALPRIESERVAEALFTVFTRVGVPQEILTDLGTQFTSEVMQEVGRLLSINQLHTTPYHPMCNGLVERFNGTMKRMLRRMCAERPKDWDRYLPALLFAYREAPQESLGFSPFELLYGRTVRGPLAILHELWTDSSNDEEIKTTYKYVIDLRNRLESTCQMAQEELSKASGRYKKYYDSRTRDRKFVEGDQVLVLLPTDTNKLLLQWKGPFRVTSKVGKHDYRVDQNGKIKTYHANLLRKYIRRGDNDNRVSAGSCLEMLGTGIVESDGGDEVMESEMPSFEQTESVHNVHIGPIDETKSVKIQELLGKFGDVFTDVPGKTELIEFKIKLTTTDPVKSKAYQVPHAVRETVKQEIDAMMKLGVIEKSESAYASPIVLVHKPDGKVRFCIDYRKLNAITVFDPEPIPNVEDLLGQISDGKFFTKLDLAKGYWQIPVMKEDREKTAFVTSEGGLFQFTVLPFGLVNAPAVFSRMMRKLLEGINHVVNYIDDILIFTDTFEQHIETVGKVLKRLREVGLTARPSKCCVAYKSLEFLGHVVSEGIIRPVPEKVDAILAAQRPCTKKEVRSFLGLVGYYRKFIPNFSAIAAPLSDLTKHGKPNNVEWGQPQELAFKTLKSRMATSPILHLPDTDRTYVVRTDASDKGLGAVLMQEVEGEKFPICFASKKLLKREQAYSVIEKECLALVWAVKKFHLYLYGRQFEIETDHHPLAYIAKTKLLNSRVMRWALSLQPYRYVVRVIRGKDNVGADFLSRCLP